MGTVAQADKQCHSSRFCLTRMSCSIRWSNAMILNNQQHSYVLSLLINISNSYLNNKLPFI